MDWSLSVFILCLYYNGLNDFVQGSPFTWTHEANATTPWAELSPMPHLCIEELDECSEGFTVTVKFKPTRGNASVPKSYILSSGGQSSMSQGFYFRQNHGKDYEVGVAVETSLWKVTFYLSTDDSTVTSSWTNVAFSWHGGEGLKVYVDGFQAASAAGPEDRVYVSSAFDQFPRITIRVSNDDRARAVISPAKVTSFKHWSKVRTSTDIVNATEKDTHVGCVSALSESGDVIDNMNSATGCRQKCQENDGQVAYHKNTKCVCKTFMDLTSSPPDSDCSSESVWHVYVVTHLVFNLTFPIHLNVEVIPPTQKGYIRPGETVTFKIQTNTDMPVTFDVSFGDGKSVTKRTDKTISHSWATQGKYKVTIIAKTDKTEEKKEVEVVITDVDEGVAPSVVEVYAKPTDESRRVDVFATAVSETSTNCTLTFGDNTNVTLSDLHDWVNTHAETHTYATTGVYDVTLHCANAYGSKQHVYSVDVKNLFYDFEDLSTDDDVMLPVTGSADDIKVRVYDQEVLFTETKGGILIDRSAFRVSGQYAVMAYSGNIVVYTKVANIQQKIGGVTVRVSKEHAQLGDTIDVEFTMPRGDHVHARLELGRSDVEYLYNDGRANPWVIKRQVKFSELGYYYVHAEYANDISFATEAALISIERPITTAEINGSDVTVLGMPTVFTISTDAGVSPARPIVAVFDYDDGMTETVRLEPASSKPQHLIHSYVYKSYGNYDVMAVIKNNISRVIVHVSVQVGHDLTYVDMYTNTERVALGEEVVLHIHTPTGSPVDYVVDMGDGNVMKINDPTLLKRSGPEEEDASGDISGDEADLTIEESRNTSAPSVSKKPNVLDGNEKALKNAYSTVSADFTNRRKTLRYTYKKTGQFLVKVNVSNTFGSKESHLCPQIVVAPEAAKTGCRKPKVTFNSLQTTVDKPVQIHRADDFIIDYKVDHGACSNKNVKSTWKIYRYDLINSKEQERPELAFCASDHDSVDRITIPGNTLWYGKYKIVATFAPESAILVTETESIYVDVKATPLLAQIAVPREVLSSKFIRLDMTESRDPDVPQNNRTGIDVTLFCYRLGANSTTANQTGFDELLDSSILVANHTNRKFYDAGNCFKNTQNIEIIDYVIVVFGASFTGNASYAFKLFVSKDERVSAVTKTMTIIAFNLTQVSLDDIDDALARGDATVALMGMAMMVADLGGPSNGTSSDDAQKARTAQKTKIIGRLGQCADIVKTPAQTEKTLTVLTSVTSNKQETNIQSKGMASGAMATLGEKTKGLTDLSLDEGKSITQGCLSTAINVLPTAKDIPKTTSQLAEAEKISHSRRRRDTSDVDAEPSCCDAHEPFCEFIMNMEEREASLRRILQDDELLDEIKTMQNQSTFQLVEFCEGIDFAIFDEYMTTIRAIELEEKLATEEQLRKGGDAALGAVEAVTGKVQEGLDGDAEVQMAVPGFAVNLTNISPKTARRKRRSGESAQIGAFSLPGSVLSAGGAGGLKSKSKDIKDSPFVPRTGSSPMTSPVTALDLSNNDGEPLVISNLDSPISLFVSTGATEPPPLFYYVFMTSLRNATLLQYHAVNTTYNDSAVKITLIPNRTSDYYLLFLKHDGFPNHTYYDFNFTLPRKDTSDDPYSFLVPQDYFPVNGTYRFGVSLIETQTRGDEVGNIVDHGYQWSMLVTRCAFWNESTEVWEGEGCKVGDQTTYNATECLCDHLTSFGGDLVVPPNTIDFNTVWAKFKDLNENAAVFSTVVATLGLYVIVMIWARYKDKQDVLKWGALPLEDNLPNDVYHYQFTVFTGVGKTKGTKSNISFIMSGDDGDTGVRCLADGKRNELPSGSIYNYILSVEHNLGSLTYLRIWHDNAGKGKMKGWYLDQVQIVDLQTGEKFFFLCDRWLAVEEDDGMVERIIPVAGMADLCAFKHLFSSSVRKKLTNDHLWVSVLSRPTRSSFTRVQRVSCCVSLLFLTMITNCMWFKSDDRVENVSVLKIGPFTFALHQLSISIMSTLIVFPVSLALVTIFKKVRPKHNRIMQTNQQKAKRTNRFKWRSINPGSDLWTNTEKKTRYQKFKDSMNKIVSSHQRSKYETDDIETQDLKKRKKKKGFTLPHWWLYIAWILCFFSVMTSAFFTILYSMEWGREKSNEWLITFLLSFFQSVLVVQPIKVLMLAAFISCILRKPEIDDDDGVLDDANNVVARKDEEMVRASEINLQEIITRRKMAASEIRPPDTAALEAARELRMKELQMEAILKECLVYFFFLMVLFFLSYQTRDSDSFKYVTNIRNVFFENSPTFKSISNTQAFWVWMQSTLLPNLYSGAWYNGKKLHWREALQVDDRNTIRVGVARLRQLRIKEGSCNVQPAFRDIIKHCRADYGWIDDDTKDYLPGWKAPPWDNETFMESLEDTESPWVYKNSVQLKSVPYFGTINTYKGGGYAVTFKRDLRRTKRLMKQLEKSAWLDVKTRGLMVEFTLYNANVNLFASIIMLVEFLSTGGTVPRTEIKVFRLSGYVGAMGVIVIFFEIVYLCFTLFFIYKMIKQLRKERMKYFKDFWNLLEFATLVLSIVAIAMYAMKKIFGMVAIDTLHDSGSRDYVNFVTIAIWDEMFGFILGCVVFVSTIKFIKLLKFNKRMGMLGDTVKLATKDLKNFSLMFFIYFFAFAQLAYVLFGRVLATYETFVGVLEGLFNFALGSFDFHAYKSAHPILGPIFFFLFVGVVYIGLMGMFLTIIGEAFTLVKENSDLQSNDYEIVDFAWNKFKGIFGYGSKRKSSEDQK